MIRKPTISPAIARLDRRLEPATVVMDIVAGESLMSKDELDEAEAVVRAGSETYVTVGRALMAIRDGKGYRLRGYNTFEAYLDGVWDMRRRQGYRLISAAQVVLDGNFVSARTQNDALPTVTQARILASLPIEERAPLIEQGVLELPTRDLSTVVRAGKAELTERRDRERPQPRLPAPEKQPDPGARPARVTLLVGDVRAALATLDAESVQCVVTSPPYFQLRDYKVPGQIGLESTPDDYIATLVEVFRDVRRVLRPDGTLWLNIGSSYAGSGKGPTGWSGLGLQEQRQGFDGTGARPYGTSDKARVGSQARGLFSRNLCDACAAAVQDGGTVRTDSRRARGQVVDSLGPSRAHTESPSAHRASSDSVDPTRPRRSSSANRDRALAPGREAEQPADVPVSTTPESSPPPPAACLHCDNCAACLSVLRSSSRDGRQCVRRTADQYARRLDAHATTDLSGSTVGSAATDDSSDQRIAGTFSAGGNSTIAPRHYKPKDLIDIGSWLAEALRADGWYLRSDIAWCKKACMPESVQDRPTSAWEHVFLLSKQRAYFYDIEAVREESVSDRLSGNGYARPEQLSRVPRGSAAPWEVQAHRSMRNYWLLGPEPVPEAHFATFVSEIPRRCIAAGSRPGDLVLDPFGGAGTTSMVAARLGRDSVYVDLKPEYADMAKDRIQADGGFTVDVELREVPG